MRPKRIAATVFFVFVTGACFGSLSHADEGSQLHIRTGILGGSYSGAFAGRFSVPAALDGDYEIMESASSSYLFAFTMALSTPDSRPYYTDASVGWRHYLFSKGNYTDQTEGGSSFVITPIWRYYFSVSLGVAQVITKSYGPVIQAVSNMTDLGFNLGTIYRLSGRVGIEGQIGGTVDYGMSSVAANGTTYRMLVGLAYDF